MHPVETLWVQAQLSVAVTVLLDRSSKLMVQPCLTDKVSLNKNTFLKCGHKGMRSKVLGSPGYEDPVFMVTLGMQPLRATLPVVKTA